MPKLPKSLSNHRVSATDWRAVCDGSVSYAPGKSLWFLGMAIAALAGCTLTFSWTGVAVFFLSTGAVLLLGHSLGSHRKLIHNSFQCPRWLEYFLVYMGVQVGLAGPLGLMRAHELRDYAQRMRTCHDYLRHGGSFWKDAWWQLNCELRLANPPRINIEDRVSRDRFYRFLEATWMLQQVPPAVLLYAAGGWSFVFFGVCARVTAGVLGHWLIGYFAHNSGAMHFEVESAAVQGRNIRLTSILTMGECWHNNHHAYPGSARLGLFAGEWDPGWWTLLLLRRLGLAWSFRLPADIPARAELHALDRLGTTMVDPQNLDRRPSPDPAQGLGDLWRALRKSRSDHAAAQLDLRLEWPAAILSARAMRWFAGAHVALVADSTLRRLVLRLGTRSFVGLPAVCILLAQGRCACRVVAALLLPVAHVLETLRHELSYDGSGMR